MKKLPTFFLGIGFSVLSSFGAPLMAQDPAQANSSNSGITSESLPPPADMPYSSTSQAPLTQADINSMAGTYGDGGWGSGNYAAAVANPDRINTSNLPGSCNAQVAQVIHRAKAEEIMRRTIEAQRNFSTLPPGGHRGMACIGDLSRMGSLLFSLPDLGSLMQRFGNVVCNMARTEITRQQQRLMQSGMAMLGLSGSGGVMNLGELIPGVPIGGLGFTMGSGGANGIGMLDIMTGNATPSDWLANNTNLNSAVGRSIGQNNWSQLSGDTFASRQMPRSYNPYYGGVWMNQTRATTMQSLFSPYTPYSR